MALSSFHKEFPPNSIEARVKEEVLRLVQEHEPSYLERALKSEMDGLKKRQKYANELSKQKKSIEQTIVELSDDLRHCKNVRIKKEEVCRELDQFTKRKRQVIEKMKVELPEMRVASKKAFYERLKDAEATFDSKRKEIDRQKMEHDELMLVVESLQNEYESIHTKMNEERKGQLDKISTVLKSNQAFASEAEDVHGQLEVVVREKRALQSSTLALKEQLSLYESQYDQLAYSSMKPEDVEKLLSKQKADADTQMERLQQEKVEMVNLRLKLEKELAELRARNASVKKEIVELERAKVMAEKKCRQTQERLQNAS